MLLQSPAPADVAEGLSRRVPFLGGLAPFLGIMPRLTFPARGVWGPILIFLLDFRGEDVGFHFFVAVYFVFDKRRPFAATELARGRRHTYKTGLAIFHTARASSFVVLSWLDES